MLLKLSLAFIASVFANAASGASNCDALMAEIDAKIRASGVSHFTLATVDAGAQVADKVVGSCDLGTKKIVYARGELPVSPPGGGSASDARSAPPRPRSEPILTECKDGSVLVGGDCRP